MWACAMPLPASCRAQQLSLIHIYPVLLDKYIMGTECEVDAICDGENFLIPGIMEQVERTGVHSGDSSWVYPAQHLTQAEIDTKMCIRDRPDSVLPNLGGQMGLNLSMELARSGYLDRTGKIGRAHV